MKKNNEVKVEKKATPMPETDQRHFLKMSGTKIGNEISANMEKMEHARSFKKGK